VNQEFTSQNLVLLTSKRLLLFIAQTHDLRNMRERNEWSATWQGRYFNFLGYFFSIYCIWKIFISTINIVFDRVGKVDPITKTFDILVNWFGIDVDVTVWSQQISFIVVGIIVVTSTRGKMIIFSREIFLVQYCIAPLPSSLFSPFSFRMCNRLKKAHRVHKNHRVQFIQHLLMSINSDRFNLVTYS
jgi:hypothetical protein